jgi:hypothetical protein
MPQLQPAPTPTPVSPESCSGPLPSAGPSSAPASGLAIIGHAISAGIAGFTATKVLSWLPECLQLVRLPAGGVSHDLWAWAPLALDLAAVVAIAAPVSFRSLLELARGIVAKRTQ